MSRSARSATRTAIREHPFWGVGVTLAALVASALSSQTPQPGFLAELGALGVAVITFLFLIALPLVAVYSFQLAKMPWRHAIEREKLLVATRRKAREGATWDYEALGMAYQEGAVPVKHAKRKHPTLSFWLYAKKPLRQPNRFRLWFSVKPKWYRVHVYAGSGDWPVSVGYDLGEVRVKGKCMEIEYLAPALSSSPGQDSGDVGQVLIFVGADAPIDIVKAAAYCSPRK